MTESNNYTKAWQYYELGKAYNQSLSPSQYDIVNTNIEFYSGNQWVNLANTPAMSRLPKPVFNIIKRVIQMFVASIASSATTVSFEPLSYYDGENINDPETNASVYATAEVKNLFEKFKMDYRIKDALIDGAVTGDYAAHFYFDPDALPYGGAFGAYKGEIKMELVDGINVMFGNPTEHDIQKQPYVLLVGRDTIGNLKDEMELSKKRGYKKNDEMCDIVPDNDYQYISGIGGKTEINAGDDTEKCTFIYLYTKKTKEEDLINNETGVPIVEDIVDADGNPVYQNDANGNPILDASGNPITKKRKVKRQVTTVYVTKATQSGVIYEDVDTGLSLYPIAFGNWERQKNQYHGRALETGIIPNQIYINKMFALLMRHEELSALPKYIYNADLIQRWTNEVGQAIGIHNMAPGQSVDNVASSIRPAEISGQIIYVIDKVMQYTKECLGATDAQLGTEKAENTTALLASRSAGETPLENPRSLITEWIEDISAILLDMMGTYYGERPLIMDKSFEEPLTDVTGNPILDPNTGTMQMKKVKHRVIQNFDFSQFKNLWFNIRVDVGSTSYWSEFAMVQTLDNMWRAGILTNEQYLERVPDKFIPRREELIDNFQQNQATQVGAQKSSSENSQGIYDAASGNISRDKSFSKMTPTMQARYQSMPSFAKHQMEKMVQ